LSPDRTCFLKVKSFKKVFPTDRPTEISPDRKRFLKSFPNRPTEISPDRKGFFKTFS